MKAARRTPKLDTAEAIEKDGRDHCRKMLAEVELHSWRRCRFYFDLDETVYITSDSGFPIATVNRNALKRELSPDQYAMFNAVFEELLVQAQVASYAVALALLDLGTQAKRSAGGRRTATARMKTAAARDQQLADDAKAMLALNPRLTKSDLGRKLSDRKKVGKESARKKMARLLRK